MTITAEYQLETIAAMCREVARLWPVWSSPDNDWSGFGGSMGDTRSAGPRSKGEVSDPTFARMRSLESEDLTRVRRADDQINDMLLDLADLWTLVVERDMPGGLITRPPVWKLERCAVAALTVRREWHVIASSTDKVLAYCTATVGKVHDGPATILDRMTRASRMPVVVPAADVPRCNAKDGCHRMAVRRDDQGLGLCWIHYKAQLGRPDLPVAG